jgi:hypothetical protein
MARFVHVLIALIVSYFVDRAAFDGRYVRQIADGIDGSAKHFQYAVQDFLRPLGR